VNSSKTVHLATSATEHADVARFRELLDGRFRAPLMVYFLKRVQDRSEAEDLTQEVFVRLMARAKPLELETAGAYVFTIAANLLRDRARRLVTHQAHAHQSLDDPTNSPAHPNLTEEIGPERVLLGRENLRAVMDALSELDERTRNIFVLFRVEKMRQRDIAALYDLSVQAVERQVVKASTHLVVRLKQMSVRDP